MPWLTLWFSAAAIIAKEDTSLEEEIKEIRQSGSNRDLASPPEFEMSDIFYFARRGVESIMDDEVTKRFTAEELETWNLLTRSNNNFQYISLRLTVLWGLGVVIRYGLLLPLRLVKLCREGGDLGEEAGVPPSGHPELAGFDRGDGSVMDPSCIVFHQTAFYLLLI